MEYLEISEKDILELIERNIYLLNDIYIKKKIEKIVINI